MNVQALLAALAPLIKPVALEICNQVVFPQIKAIEDTIGSTVAKQLVEDITAALEKDLVAALSA